MAGSLDRPRRVLHVVSYFPPDRLGGVGEVVSHIHRALSSRGHDSQVLTAGRGEDDPSIIHAAATSSGFVVSCWRHFNAARRADILHIQHGEGLALIVAMKLLRIDTPILLTMHVSCTHIRRSLRPFRVGGRWIGRSVREFVYRNVVVRFREWLDALAIRLADRVSFISKSAAEDLLGSTRCESAIVIYNGLPLESAASEHPMVVPVELLFVGSYGLRKRVHLLPDILAHVRRRRPECRMRIVGFHPAGFPEFTRRARILSVTDAFVCEGQRPSSELPRFYRSSRVLVVPSAYEGLPMVILEAYQNGLPCVATRVSGHPEVISDGETGYLSPVDDPKELAEAILKILDDPAMGERMGALGRTVVANRFSVDRQVQCYLDLYEEMSHDRRRRRGEGMK